MFLFDLMLLRGIMDKIDHIVLSSISIKQLDFLVPIIFRSLYYRLSTLIYREASIFGCYGALLWSKIPCVLPWKQLISFILMKHFVLDVIYLFVRRGIITVCWLLQSKAFSSLDFLLLMLLYFNSDLKVWPLINAGNNSSISVW